MIHVLNSSGVPSVAKIITIQERPSHLILIPQQVMGLSATPVGGAQINWLTAYKQMGC
jgi:hypothetical protein